MDVLKSSTSNILLCAGKRIYDTLITLKIRVLIAWLKSTSMNVNFSQIFAIQTLSSSWESVSLTLSPAPLQLSLC